MWRGPSFVQRILLASSSAARVLLPLAILILMVTARPVTAHELARPAQQSPGANITSPEGQSTVVGNVEITGSAVHPQFQRYELYYTVEPGENWVFIGEAHFAPVINGVLGIWNTGGLPDGTYSLRLRVVRADGNYDEAYQRNIVLSNTSPTPTPTSDELLIPTLPLPSEPTATPTPEATSTPISVEQPEIPTPTPRPTATPTPEREAPIVEEISDDSGFFSSAVNTDALRDALATGLAYTGGIFLAVGAFFGIKRLLTWLWYLIAP